MTRRLTRPQRRALATLDPVILRQFADLQAQGVAWATLVSLMRDAPAARRSRDRSTSSPRRG